MSVGFPVCLVEIHGAEETFTLQLGGGDLFGASPSGDLISCTTEKRLATDVPAGAFEVMLAHSKDQQGRTWMDKIRPQDMVVIQMQRHTGASGPNGAGDRHTVMIGWVDTVTETTALNSSGHPERRIVVRGHDGGGMFTSGIVTYWISLGALMKEIGLQTFQPDASQYNAAPPQVVKQLVDDIFQNFLEAQVMVDGETRTFFEFLAYRLSSFGVETPQGYNRTFLGAEQNFWEFFKQIASPPFHELFVDTRQVKAVQVDDPDAEPDIVVSAATFGLGLDHSSPTLIMRPTPFPYLTKAGDTLHREAWDRLVLHTVGIPDGLREDPIQSQVSVSKQEQFNLFLPTPQYEAINVEHYLSHAWPVVDKQKLLRYGYRPWTRPCALVQAKPNGTPTDSMMQFYRKLTWRIASWNALNDQFLSGAKTLLLSPHLHVGERLLDRSGWQEHPTEFYIEMVAHRFVFGEPATTTVGLTRGLPVRLDWQDYANEYAARLDQVGLQDINPAKVAGAWRDQFNAGQSN